MNWKLFVDSAVLMHVVSIRVVSWEILKFIQCLLVKCYCLIVVCTAVHRLCVCVPIDVLYLKMLSIFRKFPLDVEFPANLLP